MPRDRRGAGPRALDGRERGREAQVRHVPEGAARRARARGRGAGGGLPAPGIVAQVLQRLRQEAGLRMPEEAEGLLRRADGAARRRRRARGVQARHGRDRAVGRGQARRDTGRPAARAVARADRGDQARAGALRVHDIPLGRRGPRRDDQHGAEAEGRLQAEEEVGAGGGRAALAAQVARGVRGARRGRARRRLGDGHGRGPRVSVNLFFTSWDCGGDPGPRKGYTEDRMYSTEQRRPAIETFIRFDHSYADTIAELGYPDRHTLNNWWRGYGETGEVPVGKMIREPRFSDDQKREAVEHYLGHGKSPRRTMRALGYPRDGDALRGWIDELAPGQRKHGGPNPRRGPVPIEKKVRVIAELEARTGPAAQIAEKHGVPRTAPYVWRREMMGDDVGEPETKGEPVGKEYDDLPDDIEVLQDMLRGAKMQLGKVRLELEVRQATLEIVKKDPGAEPGLPTNAERAAMVEALRAVNLNLPRFH